MLETAALSALLLSYAVIPGTASDHFGQRVGGISALRYDDLTGRLIALPDRGPDDGATPFTPRFYEFSWREDGKRLTLELERTVLFRDHAGEIFSGLNKTTHTRLDPEGLVVAPDGTLYVSEEYGPYVYHFDRDGRQLSSTLPPETYLADPKFERGRVRNRGLEGLCLTPDKKTLAAVLQSPRAQDGGKAGKYTRMLLWELPLGQSPPREFRLPMPDAGEVGMGLAQKDFAFNECEAESNDVFWLLVRANRGRGADPGRPTTPSYKRFWRVKLEGGEARRVGELDVLKVLTDGGIPAADLPVKFESLAYGEERTVLWGAVDNDFFADVPTYVFRLRLR